MTRRWALVSCLLAFAIGTPGLAAEPLRPESYEETIHVACIGDSITFGAGIRDRGTQSYPAQLGKLLGAKFAVRNFGVSAATLLKQGNKPYWKLRAFKQATALAPHVVVIKLGTNDSKPPNWTHKAAFAGDLRALVDHFAGLTPKPRVWLCLPVPVYRTRWGINEATVAGEIAPIIRQVAAEKGCPTIDLHAALSGRADLFPDGIHPNAAGAGLMARAVYTALLGKAPPRPEPVPQPAAR